MRQMPSMAVEGRATITVVPDTAEIALGAVTERPRAAEAAAGNSRATQAVIDIAKAEGIDARDIKTLSVGLTPVYDRPAQGSPKITGFRAANELRIRVRPIERASPILGELIDKV